MPTAATDTDTDTATRFPLAALRALGPCAGQYDVVRDLFPDGVPLTVAAAARLLRAGVDLEWALDRAGEMLPELAPAREAYRQARAAAWEAHVQATAAAREAYQQATAPAREAYRQATAAAWEAYRQARAPAWEAHEQATAAAREAHEQATAAAWEAYRQARAAAWEAYRQARAAALQPMLDWLIAHPQAIAGLASKPTSRGRRR
jgi:hypothetical protein